jgi:hypothetical protein
MNYTTFAEAARTVTAPGYEPLPFDEDLALFQEHGRALLSVRDDMTDEEFATFCREADWIGGTFSEITPFLDALRKSEEEA